MNELNLQKILALDCWQGDVRIVELSGGITNKNYLVEDRENKYVARVCDDRSYLGINRDNERVCQQAAHRAGVAPAVIYHEADLLVTQFVESRTLNVDDLAEKKTISRIASTLRQLHESQKQHVGEMLYFCPFQTVRTYVATARRLGASLPSEIDDDLQDAAALSRQMSPFYPVMCHNDLLAANILDDGSRLWLVDWEYAGVGNPLFDIASVSANGSLTDDIETYLLSNYAPGFTPQMRFEVKVLKVISLLREALWGMIQSVVSEIDFDYEQYADENLAAYAAAKRQL